MRFGVFVVVCVIILFFISIMVDLHILTLSCLRSTGYVNNEKLYH
jgi:hypothetical protein